MADGATVPLSQSSAEVDLDQVLSMFDPKTAEGIRETTIGFSDALAGRGSDINNAIGAFVPLLTRPAPGRHEPRLAADRSRRLLPRARVVLAAAAEPVAQTQADLYVNLDTTFRALAPVAVPFLQDWISRDAADVQHGDQRQPELAGVPAQHGGSVLRTAARVSQR